VLDSGRSNSQRSNRLRNRGAGERPRHPDYSELCALDVDPDRFEEGIGLALR
jgi:hypothetical protein